MRPIRPQTVTLVVLAIFLGLAAAYTAQMYLKSKPILLPEAPPPPMAQVVYAQSNMPANSRIRVQDVAEVMVPVEKVPPGAFKYGRQAVGRVVKTAVLANSPIGEKDLWELGKGPLLTDMLKPGEKAVTLRIDDPLLTGGSLRSGALVDVMLTYTKTEDETAVSTQRLVHAIRVLGPPITEGGESSAAFPFNGKTYITVAATPEQANRLMLAQQAGTIGITLCDATPAAQPSAPPDDSESHSISVRDLLGLSEPEPPPVRKVSEIYRGAERESIVFNAAGELLATEQEAAAASAAAAATAPKKKCKTCGKKSPTRAPSREIPQTPGQNLQPTPDIKLQNQQNVPKKSSESVAESKV